MSTNARTSLGSLGAIVAAIAWLACTSCEAASTVSGGDRARATIDFRIVIPPVIRMQALRQPESIRVTEADVAAGYVDLGPCLELEVVNNVRGGYSLQVALAGTVVREARLSGPGSLRVTALGSQLQLVRSPGSPVRRALSFQVRIDLAPGVAAGTYPWPLHMTLAKA